MARQSCVLILSGFLGSGKTTALMGIIGYLREKHGDDYRIAIIENEIGAVSVDAGIIQNAGYSVTEMMSGCVCCTLAGELVPALKRLEEDMAPDLIVLEATGMAEPAPIRDTIARYGGFSTRIVTVVDAFRWGKIVRALGPMLEKQVAAADAVCIGKVDLVDDEALAAVRVSVGQMSPGAPVVERSGSTPLSEQEAAVLLGGLHD